MPSGKLSRVADFLPPPGKLVIPEDNIKITLLVKKSSMLFFKQQALKYHTKYQKMMREVLDLYVLGNQHVS